MTEATILPQSRKTPQNLRKIKRKTFESCSVLGKTADCSMQFKNIDTHCETYRKFSKLSV